MKRRLVLNAMPGKQIDTGSETGLPVLTRLPGLEHRTVRDGQGQANGDTNGADPLIGRPYRAPRARIAAMTA